MDLHIPLSTRIRDIVLICVTFGILYVGFAWMRPLASPDEGRYAEIPREMAETGDYVTPRLNGMPYFYKPPLFYWLQAASIKAFGINRTSTRLPNSAMAIFGIIATYLAASALYNRRTAICAAAILGTSLFYFALGEVVTLDMTVSVLMAAAGFAFITLLKYDGAKRAALILAFSALCALAVMAKGLIGILIPSAAAFIYALVCPKQFFGRLKRGDLLWIPLGILLFAAIAVPWHVLAANANPPYANAEGIFSKNWEGQGFFWYYIIHEHFLRYIDAETSMREQPFWFFFVLAPVGFFPWIVALPQALMNIFREGRKKVADKHSDIIFFMIWTAFVILFFSVSKSKLVPYIISVYPPTAVVLAVWAAKVWEEGANLKWIARIFSALAHIAAVAAIVIFFVVNHKYPDDTLRELAICLPLAAVMEIFAVAIWRAHRAGNTHAFMLRAFGAIFALLCFFNPLGGYLQRPSAQPLAEKIAEVGNGSEKVLVLNDYNLFQDLPVWLDKLVYLGETPPEEQKFGYMRERSLHEKRFLKNDEELKNFLCSGERIFIAAKENKLPKLEKLGVKTKPLCRNGFMVLLETVPENGK